MLVLADFETPQPRSKIEDRNAVRRVGTWQHMAALTVPLVDQSLLRLVRSSLPGFAQTIMSKCPSRQIRVRPSPSISLVHCQK